MLPLAASVFHARFKISLLGSARPTYLLIVQSLIVQNSVASYRWVSLLSFMTANQSQTMSQTSLSVSVVLFN